MPYFISDTEPDCSGWATVKLDEGGEPITIHCHATKQEAIDQMVAISLKEGLEPGGERALPDNYRPALADNVPEGRACGNCYFYDESNVQGDKAWCERWDDYVDGGYYCNAWRADEVDDNDQEDTEDDTAYRAPAPPEDQITGSDANAPGSASGAGGDIKLGENTQTALRNKVSEHNDAMAAADRPDWTRTTFGQLAAVYRRGSGAYSSSHRPGVSRAAWSMARVNAFLYLLRRGRPQNAAYTTDFDLLPEGHPKSTRTLDERQVNLELPEYIREAAARGLEYYADGLAGDGVVARTIREARLLADGQVSEDKVIRASAWAARHLVDLDAEDNRDPDADGFPGAGAVAFYLWGINPLAPQAAIEWYARKAEQIREEERSVIVVSERAGATIEHMNSTVETRRITVNEFEIREDVATEGMRFAGYAAVFDSPSEPLPFIEQIRPGAFATSLSSRNEIKMFVNHDTTRVLASKRAGTLRLSEDSHGLRVEADLPPTTDGKDLAILMRRGDVDSMSFGFSVPKGGDAWSPDGATRELREVRLHEVSIVTAFPAYAATSAGVRSLENLAAATGADASLLDAAITKLEAGEMLDDEAAMLIESVVQKLRADTTIGSDAKASLEMKRKQLDLLFARV